jgi:hypothetical protein
MNPAAGGAAPGACQASSQVFAPCDESRGMTKSSGASRGFFVARGRLQTGPCRIVELPSVSGWFDTHDKFEAIDFRHSSRLLVLSGARSEKKGDMGRHYYVLENGKLRWLKTIRQGWNFMAPNR